MAREHHASSHLEEAVKVCRAGLEKHPAYHSARVLLARALLGLGKHEEASIELQSVCRQAPDNVMARRLLAEAYAGAGEWEGARATLQELIRLHPGDAESLERLRELQEESPTGEQRRPEPLGAVGISTVKVPPGEVLAEPAVPAVGPREFLATGASEPEEEEETLPPAPRAELEPAGLQEESTREAARPEAEPELSPTIAMSAEPESEPGSGSFETLAAGPWTGAGPDSPAMTATEAIADVTDSPSFPPTMAMETSLFQDGGRVAEGEQATTIILGPEDFPVRASLPGEGEGVAVEEQPVASAADAGSEPAVEDLPGPAGSEAGRLEFRTVLIRSAELSEAEGSAPAPENGDDDVVSSAVPTPTLAELYQAQGMPERALQIYEQVLDGDPENAEVRERIRQLRKNLAPPAENINQRKIRVLRDWIEAIRR